jgi:broad specificity phosphatase PhoE
MDTWRRAVALQQSRGGLRRRAQGALGLLCLAHHFCRASQTSSSTRTVYVVRHAESRWNAAWQRLNVAAMMAETDHGLTVVGVDQAGTLAGVLLASPISLARPGARIASSPLCRALQTATVAVAAANVRDPVAILVLPDARESGGRLGFGRDSAGTPTHEIVANLDRELRAAGAEAAAAALRRGDVSLDLRVLEVSANSPNWWLPLESKAEKRARLRRLLGELFRLAAPAEGEDGAPTRLVLMSHSYLMRDLFRDHVDESSRFARSDLRERLARKAVPNCAVLAIDLALAGTCDGAEAERKGEVANVVGVRLLGGAGSVQK